MEDVIIKVKVPRSQLAFFVAIIESYEGLGVVRVTHRKETEAEIYTSAYAREILSQLFNSLRREGVLIRLLRTL